ncbi:hypothetical protein AVEN_125048-1 [Araneus ventricosus]|uniref:Uncharacterized protein n=1 Tax=Araneus ventricosus TaxID=182803 RepID=A0A4Y2GRC6_ARAVE|nr:hypothetical protein AVEN_125048-1 [Araneus ventricosus]
MLDWTLVHPLLIYFTTVKWDENKEEKTCYFAISRQEPHPWSKKDPFHLAGEIPFSCGGKKLKVLIAASVCNIKLLAIFCSKKRHKPFLSLSVRGHYQTS